MIEKLVIAATVLIAAIVLIGVYARNVDCRESGGVLVRTAFDYECIRR